MKILKIDNGCGHYCIDIQEETWAKIDEIDKHGLLTLLNLFLENDVEMDDPDELVIQHDAHKIIYGNIFEKLSALSDSKKSFKDQSERMYLEELTKYSAE